MILVDGRYLAVTAFLIAAAPAAGAAEYFFDSLGGSDEGRGTSARAPFKTLGRLSKLDLQPGDVVRFKRGSTFRGQLDFRGNGTKGRPIRLTAYGRGPKPEILGSIRPTGWERHKGELYRVKLPQNVFVGNRAVYGVCDYPPGAVPVRLRGGRHTKAPPTERGRFHYDEKSRLLYVITGDGRPPSEHHLEASVISTLMTLNGRSWIEIENLAFLFGNRTHVGFRGCRDVVLRDCASLFVAPYGNPNIVITRGSTRVKVADCFLYENVNCGVYITDRSTKCVISGCTIVKCKSNDGVAIHDGRRAGDHNVVENNVIGLCPEESIDITSGDYHVIRGNICYGNGNPGIIVGHDSDHILIQNNICFGNKRAGIQVQGNEKEGARGENRILQNLVFENGYPGLEIADRNTRVFNNTVVNSRRRVAVRIGKKARGSVLRNNLVVTLDPAIGHASLQFLGGTPGEFDVKLGHNLFFHAARRDGRALQTREGNFTPAGFLEKYGTGEGSRFAAPRFVSERDRLYFLASGSPGVDAGADVGLPFTGRAPDVGWKERGSELLAPKYPRFWIDGRDDDAAILYLWGKSKALPPKESPPFAWDESAPSAADGRTEAEAALARARAFLKRRGKEVLARHYLQVARASAPKGSNVRREAERLLTDLTSGSPGGGRVAALSKEITMRTLELSDQALTVETLYEDDFSAETGDWLAEGGAIVSVKGGRLFMDAYRGEPHVATIWCRRPFEGDAVIEYTVRVEEGPGNTNINFFVYGANPDGSSVLETTGGRTGAYKEYHRIPNYIYTYLNSGPDGKPDLKTKDPAGMRTRVRFRKDPGFHLVREAWRDEAIRKGRDYRFTIAIQGARMRFYVDGQRVIDHKDHEDHGQPHRRGHHAFRTWMSHISADVFRVSRTVSAAPRKGGGRR